jgi:pyruvate dehydrogenase E2 component (dihydrolipoamide acetyltransferase)
MEEGTILRWLKADGDTIRRGDGLAEIETDKATGTYEAEGEGVLTIVALQGETLPVGAVIARLGDDGAAGPEAVGDPRAREPGEPTNNKGEVTAVELTRTQRTTARRFAEAKAIVPEHTLQAEVDMEACVELRARAGAQAPTYEDLVIKATGMALREVPRANGAYRDGAFELYGRVNVGFVVPTQDAIVTPTVFDADRKRLEAISRETRELAEVARAGTIRPPQVGGATFTIASLGDFGVDAFEAIIVPPQAGVLAVGTVAPRATVRDGALVARHTLIATLTCDHRILYGAEAARFLQRVRALLEHPQALAL